MVHSSGYCSELNPDFDAYAQLCAVDPPDFLTGTWSGGSGGPLAAYGPNGQLVEIGIIDQGPVDCNKRYVRQTVIGALGGRAKPARSYSAACSRQSSTRFTCSVKFWHGPTSIHSGHPQTCIIHTRRGTW